VRDALRERAIGRGLLRGRKRGRANQREYGHEARGFHGVLLRRIQITSNNRKL
jgi:hypothetical protein